MGQVPALADWAAKWRHAGKVATLSLLAVTCLPGEATAAPPPAELLEEVPDPQQIEEGEPVTVQDERTNDPGELSVQYSGSYSRSRQADAREVLEQGQTLKLGVFKGIQVSLSPAYNSGRGNERNSGDLSGDVLLHLADQSRLLPAFGVDLFYSTPFGAGHKSAEYVFRTIGSWSLGTGDEAPRLHLNLTDSHLTQPDDGGRKDQLQLAFGGSFLPTPDGAVVTDIVYGASDEGRGTKTFLEIGYTRVLPHAWTCELGIGKQVAGAANATRVFFSIEKEINIF